jgi:hypothetical protein
MCYYIYALFPKPVTIQSVNTIARQNGLAFEEVMNVYVQAPESPREIFFLKSCKPCDCGTSLGSLNKTFVTDDPDLVRKVQKLRLKGWSETKINRWLDTKEIYFEKNRKLADAYHEYAVEHSGEIDTYIRFLGACLTTTPYIGLVLHWHSRGNSLTHIADRARLMMSIKELTPEVLLAMQTNTIYQFE